MTTTTTGTVLNVLKGTKEFSTAFGSSVTYKILIETETGQIAVERNGLATGNFNIKKGTKVQVTYEAKTIQGGPSGSFISNKIVKDGLLILQDNGEALQVDAKGQAKAVYVKQEQITYVAGSPGKTAETKPAVTQAAGTFQKSSGYSNEGARNGMIVNASLALAIARKDTRIERLLKAADDIKSLTAYVETSYSHPYPSNESLSKSAQGIHFDTGAEDDSPFNP